MKIQKTIALICCALLAGCAAPTPPVPTPQRAPSASQNPQVEIVEPLQENDDASMSLEALLETVNQTHKDVEKPLISFESYIRPPSQDDFEIFDYEEGPPFEPGMSMTMEQAQEDVDILFRALETTYGPYQYFGGDDAFGQAKEAILAECAREDSLTAGFFVDAVLENLRFIRDGHFRVNGTGMSQTILGYAYSAADYQKTDRGYETADGRVVASVEGAGVDGKGLDELFRMSISQTGDVVWYPVILTEAPSDLSAPGPDLTVSYEDGSSETFSADPWESGYREDGEMVELHDNQGIPVLFVRNMGFDEAQGDELGTTFLEFADQLKDEPVLIVDLRSNGGGNLFLPFKWFQRYAGQFVPTNYVGLKYWSQDDMLEYSQNTENPYYTSYETMTELGGFEPVSDAYMSTNGQPDAFVPNDRLLIVLTGKNTASAAETFTDMAHNLENTLIIGQNTFGCLISNAYTTFYLPVSGVSIQLGCDLCFFPEGSFEEFAGYQPDLWVSGDAEEAAVRLVKHLQSK